MDLDTFIYLTEIANDPEGYADSLIFVFTDPVRVMGPFFGEDDQLEAYAYAEKTGLAYEVQTWKEAPAAQDLALSAEEFGDRSAEPSLVRGYHLDPDAAWLPVSRGNHGLVQSQGLGVAAVQQHGRGVLR